MSALMFGISKIPEIFAIILAVSGLSGLVIFVIYELRVDHPVFNINLLRTNRLFAFSNLAALINYATTFGITFLLSLYLQFAKGLSPRDAGLILVTQPAIMAVVASISGKMSDTHDPRILSSLGMGMIVAGLILLVFLNGQTGTLYLVATLAVVGIGFGMFSSPNTNAIMGAVDKKYLGIASATVSTMRLTGQMFSLGIATLMLHLFIGTAQITEENIPGFLRSFHTTFIIFALLCFGGIFASLARGKRQKAG
jgi:MFS family permease